MGYSKVILFYTDNSLPEDFFNRICRELVKASSGIPIISISQKPIDLGTNICVGDIGRSHKSLYTQILTGCKASNADVVFLAEHDCMYHPEHFTFIPQDRNTFYYNLNHWFVQWAKGPVDGLYSRKRRKCLSQCVGFRESMIEAIEEKLSILNEGFMIAKGVPGAMEPGCISNHEAFKKEQASLKDLGKDGGKWRAEGFRTQMPNLDIRHGANFSGQRRGGDRCWEIPYWGKFNDYYYKG